MNTPGHSTGWRPWLAAALMVPLLLVAMMLGFFLFLLCFKMSPFEPLKDAAGQLVSSYPAAAMLRVDGNGMNPLLQNVYMAIHPPIGMNAML